MDKKIRIDASDDPALARKVFSAIVGAKPLPGELSDDRSGKKIVEDIADQVGVSRSTAKRLVGKVMQREILTEGVNQKMARSFVDPLTTHKDNPKMPGWSEIAATIGKGRTNKDRAEDAAELLARLRAQSHFTDVAVERATDKKHYAEEQLADLEEIAAWMALPVRHLEAPNGSAWYRLRDARREGRLEFIGEWKGQVTARGSNFFDVEPQVFVISHNWAAAFRAASDFQDGEYPVPFDNCVFEFQIDGRRVLVPTRRDESGEPLSIICFEGKGYWMCCEGGSMQAPPADTEDGAYPLYQLLYENVRALCIALDAEVVVTSVTRAPHRLNIAREKQGRSTLNDYHVINLARRSRVEALPSSGDHEARWHPRLHFRRGHWRHFTDHKTWIKWMLIGNPDLGFIDKEYRA